MQRKVRPFFYLLFIFAFLAIPSPAWADDSLLSSGIDAFIARDFGAANNILQQSLAQEPGGTQEALLYLAKTSLILGDIFQSEQYVNRYMREFSAGRFVGEMLYLRARINFLNGKYETAIDLFLDFLNNFHDNFYTPCAYYWLSRSLVETGNLSQAVTILTTLNNAYPGFNLEDQSRRWIYRAGLMIQINEVAALIEQITLLIQQRIGS